VVDNYFFVLYIIFNDYILSYFVPNYVTKGGFSLKLKTRDLILTGLFAALTAVGAYITIPLPYVPLTLQVFFCMFAGVILGSKLGMLSQIIYVLIGLIGVPVFAGGVGGFSYILKPSFGYLIGFIIAAYIIGKIVESHKEISFGKILTAELIGLIVIYILGISYMLLIVNLYVGKPMTLVSAIKVGFIPFILADLIKALLCSAIANQALVVLRKSGLISQS
jgi:biotin transport system substrate-specific component